MSYLFQKLEATSTHAEDLLTPEDRAFCENLFNAYKTHQEHYKNLLHYITLRNGIHKEKMNGTDSALFRPLKEVKQAVDHLTSGRYELTTAFVERMETHFSRKYNTHFRGFAEAFDLEAHQPFNSYQPIIDNIVVQVGHDLVEAGKGQIKRRFLDQFGTGKLAPVRKGRTITLPLYCNLDVTHGGARYALDDYKEKTTYLLDALVLFFFNRTSPTETVAKQLSGWKSVLMLDHPYPLFAGCSIRFFRNRRVDLLFGDAANAAAFWNLFDLETLCENTSDPS
jgi:hypothetical protein